MRPLVGTPSSTIAIWVSTLLGEVLFKRFSEFLLNDSIVIKTVRHITYLAEFSRKRLFLSLGQCLGDHLLLGAIESRFKASCHLINHSGCMFVILDSVPVI